MLQDVLDDLVLQDLALALHLGGTLPLWFVFFLFLFGQWALYREGWGVGLDSGDGVLRGVGLDGGDVLLGRVGLDGGDGLLGVGLY